MGVPRYIPMWSVVGIPNIPATCSFVRLGVLEENHNLDLVTLISWPEDSQKCWSILRKFLQSLALASSSLIDNCSKQRMNRYADKGSPCLTPILGTTSGRGVSFHKIWNQVNEIIFIMNVMKVGGS